MDLKQLQALGAIVTRNLFKKEIAVKRLALKPKEEWENENEPEESGEIVDDTLTAWIRKRSSADFLEMIQAPDRFKPHIAVLRCVCHEDGSEVFESLDQVKQLKEWLFIPLIIAINEVNAFGLKNLQPKTNSGTSLPSSSAARSRKLRHGSAKKNALVGLPIVTSAAP